MDGNIVGTFFQSTNKTIASIPAGATTLVTFTCAGAALGDVVVATWNGAPTTGIVVQAGWATSADTVVVPFTNITAGAVDPADTFDFTLLVFRLSGNEPAAS